MRERGGERRTGPRPRWIYVTGTGRSGSTLLGGLIEDRLAGFDCGELAYLWTARVKGWRCGCGDAVADCEVWAAVVDEVRRRVPVGSDHEAAERMRRLINPPDRTYLRRHHPTPYDLALRAATERAVEKVTGASLLVDTSKRLLPLAIATAIDRPVLVVHLVRDPRGVAYSNAQAKTDPARGGALVIPPRPAWRSAVRWLALNLLIERTVHRDRRRPSSVATLRLRYEDLVSDADAAMGRIADAAGAGHGRSSGPRVQRHSVAGNPSRLSDRPLALDERWRAGLDARARVATVLATGPLAVRYGYVGRRGARPQGRGRPVAAGDGRE